MDASVAVKWVVNEPQADDARQLLDPRFQLHAPRLLATDVANALRRKVGKGELEASETPARIALVLNGPLRWADDEAVAGEAMRIAIAVGHSVYDCTYLALAHQLGAHLVTADLKFVRRVAPTAYGDAVVALGDYAGE